MESTKIEVRSNVKFLTKLGWKSTDIINALSYVYGDSAPPDPTVYRWIREFKEGRNSVEDEQRSGRPRTSTTEEHIIAVRRAVELDRRVTIEAIAEEVGISHGRVHAILTKNLELSKLSARWVPHMLRPEHKAQRIECATNLLNRLETDRDDF